MPQQDTAHPTSKPANRTSNQKSFEQQWENVAEQFQESCAGQAEDFTHLMERVSEEVTRYCRHRPKVVALGLLGLGFMVGWKLKP